ncbi:MAG: ATP/GTP-binding protein [Bacteroidetes bacterium]|nr:ATP/GTP-binding protein [Bacteroidota bacterium]MBS1540388.1 ATP/GTP-binding protein [Bacteroidota bacterium]
MKTYLLFFLLIVSVYAQSQTLTLKWKTDTLLRAPESVLVDHGNNVLYVSNINGKGDAKDGNGFISKVGTDGKIITLKWAEGLDGPKGLGLYKGKLYVADITQVVVIDVATGKIAERVEVAGAQFLNDITVDSQGVVYISDTRAGKIYSLSAGKIATYFESPELNGVNGLLSEGHDLYVLNFATGKNYKLDPGKKLTHFATTAQGADGVVPYGKGYLVSSWNGEIDHVSDQGITTKLLDTRDKKINSADIDYDAKTKTLYVPTFFANSVMAYEVK